jgi:aspartyl-tRNA(Asn)/glutamyl-tRNA(Gln) amidotransferase subunit A
MVQNTPREEAQAEAQLPLPNRTAGRMLSMFQTLIPCANQIRRALGTDTGGSIRLPAAYNGIIGFKPSYGMISRFGVVAYANSLDTVGILANKTFKIEAIFRAVSIKDLGDPTCASQRIRKTISRLPWSVRGLGRPLRVGIPAEYNIHGLSKPIQQAWTKTAEALKRLGAHIVSVSLPNTKYALSAYYVLAPAETSSNLARYDGVRFGSRGTDTDAVDGILYGKRRGDLLGEEVKKRILLGTYTLSSEAMDNYFIRAQKIRRLVQQDFDRVFAQDNILHDEQPTRGGEGVDLLLCPTAPTLAPKLADLQGLSSVQAYMNDVFTVPASLAGLPAISIPFKASGGPESNIGLQLIGQYGMDKLVLNIAKSLEESGSSWRSREKQIIGTNSQPKVTGPSHVGFSPELAKNYMHMRQTYGNSMKAVQHSPYPRRGTEPT